MSESFSGGVSEIMSGSERRAERVSTDAASSAPGGFGGDAFVERALAILARQGGAQAGQSGVAASTGQPLPSGNAIETQVEALRRQAVNWIDALLALVTAGVGAVPAPAGTTSTTTAPRAPVADAPTEVLRFASQAPAALSTLAASAGQRVAATMRIANDGGVEAPVRFIASDLVGDSGARIPASAVTFAPAVATVAAHAVRAIDVIVAIPAALPPGSYAGLLQAVGQPLVRSLLAVDVKPATGSMTR